MQVHLFVKEDTNYMNIKKKIKEYLIEIGACGISSPCFMRVTQKKDMLFSSLKSRKEGAKNGYNRRKRIKNRCA